MARNVVARLLGLVLSVAVLAMTAVLVGSRRAPGAPLATDNEIRDELYTFASEHAGWRGVADLVRDLADRTGRRIALVEPDGTVIADSAGGAALPSVPADRIDAAAPVPEGVTAVPSVVAAGGRVRLGFYQWQLTAEERRERQALAEAAVECVRRLGLSARDGCTPPELLAPSAATVALTRSCAGSPQWTSCVAAGKRAQVAGPADLFLGAGADPWRVAALVLVVLVVAVAITVPVGRRIVRPVDDMAHELRAPLTTIRGHLEAVLDGVLPADPGLVRSMIDEAVLLERLIGDLSGDRPVVEPVWCDAAVVAAQVVAGVRGAVRLGAASPVPVRADPARLRQALGNLVSNALRHGGEPVGVWVWATGASVLLAVADSGPGIDPRALPRLFDRGYRGANGGAGLGLAITRYLVEAHGGRIEVVSSPAGSVFTIRLPR